MKRRRIATPGVQREWRTPQQGPATHDFFRAVQEDVIVWWREHQRTDLPWRQPRPAVVDAARSGARACTPLYNPYEVWVSEVMSQQTRMETVIPYFKRWMERFPSVETLAASSESEVKAVWAGMGYYRRALYLHKGAQYLLEWRRCQLTRGASSSLPSPQHAIMPSTQLELLKVPGIGPYTSAAIASLCFGEAVCSVDGNVIRVLSRLRGERGFDPKVPANVKQACVWGQELMGNTLATASVVCRDPSALNQGLMEIGASVCRPGGPPLCSSCPLQRHCCASALLQGGQIDAIEGVIPERAATMTKRRALEICVVHEVGERDEQAAKPPPRRFVVVRRPSDGLLGGMLEFPTVRAACTVAADASDSDETAAPPLPLLEHPLSALTLPGRVTAINTKLCGCVRHIFSHIDMDVEVVHVRWPAQVCERDLLKAIADAIDDHYDGVCNPSPAATRISLMSEPELRSAAPSRLMLKVLQQLSSAASSPVKRARRAAASRQSDSATDSPARKAPRRAVQGKNAQQPVGL